MGIVVILYLAKRPGRDYPTHMRTGVRDDGAALVHCRVGFVENPVLSQVEVPDGPEMFVPALPDCPACRLFAAVELADWACSLR